ncbi:MAG TPA: hypothetical protein ACFYEK_01355 [Candidatus Wunengus sp. YC60]|uniref:hypothetical protein n=1 Tax=Candidatus Wunengus sp. YC60 TaxID=3367697 RepID=UPI0040298E76
MKRIILALAFVALAVGMSAQGITASNGTVVVKQGTVSILGGITGTFVASGTGTTVISGTPTVAITGSVNATPAITALALTSTSATTSQTIAAGAKVVTIETSTSYTGNIDGVAATAGNTYAFSAGPNGTLPQIIVTVSAGTIYIRKLQ